MSILAQSFWWLRGTTVSPSLWNWALQTCIFVISTIAISLSVARSDYGGIVTYGMIVFIIPMVFRGLSAPLHQLASSEALRLQPKLVEILTQGMLLCVVLLSGLGVISSLILLDWLPMIASFYVASVAASLIPPVAASQDSVHFDPSLKKFGADHLGWPAILLLSLPVLALSLLPERMVLSVMLLLGGVLLRGLPRRLVCMQAPTAPSRGVWREPSFAVFANVLILAVAVTVKASSMFFMFYMVMSSIGMTALGRAAPALRALLGRMWLSGMSRRRLYWFCLGRLVGAVGQELAIYLLALLPAWALGLLQPDQLMSFMGMLFVWMFGNGMHALENVLHGKHGSDASGWCFALHYLPLAISLAALLVLALEGSLLGIYGLLALLATLAGLAWATTSNCRRFETAEL